MSLTREQFHQHIKHLIDRTDLHVTSAFALEDHDAAQRAEIERLHEGLEIIARGDWELIQTRVGKDKYESVTLEGDYSSDARYHYPYRMKVLYKFAKMLLGNTIGQ